MKQRKKWLAVLLICTQVLTSTPLLVTADTIDDSSVSQQITDSTQQEDEEATAESKEEEDADTEEDGDNSEIDPAAKEEKNPDSDKENETEEGEELDKDKENSSEKEKVSDSEKEQEKDEKKEPEPKPDNKEPEKTDKGSNEPKDSKTENSKTSQSNKLETTSSSEQTSQTKEKPQKKTETTTQTEQAGEQTEPSEKPKQANDQPKQPVRSGKQSEKEKQPNTSQLEPKVTEKQEEKQPDSATTEKTADNSDATDIIPNDNYESSYPINPIEDTWNFIELIGEDAREIGQEEDLYASVMIAQAILESDSGKSQLSKAPYFNLFGIKGADVSFTTIENDIRGRQYATVASFRQYANYDESLQDYVNLLKTGLTTNKNFYKGTWKSEAQDYQTATKFLTGRYAVDIHYHKKLDAIIKAYDLTSYDEAKNELPNESVHQVTPVKNTWEFIDLIGEDAREIGQKEDLYSSVMIAQAILESASGQSQLSQAPYFNLFGVKGAGASFTTAENDAQGNQYSTIASFRQYASYEETLQDYADLLKTGLPGNKNFYKGVWKSEAQDYQTATKSLTGRYATDPHYHEKLDAIIETYDLINYDEAEKELGNESGDYITPVEKPTLTSQFGQRGSGFHRGIDFAAAKGTPIKAAKNGKVIQSEYHPSWGNYVAIKHSDGLTTLYAHCSRNIAKVGQTVKQGQTIALLGSTGNSTGPHLHFEVNRSQNLEQKQLINPLQVLKE